MPGWTDQPDGGDQCNVMGLGAEPPKVMVTLLPSQRRGGEKGLETCQTPHVPETLATR
jgi:hypothetical protein